VNAVVSLNWLVLAPALVPAVGAVLVLVLDAVWPTRGSWLPALGAVLCLAGAGFALRAAVVDDDPLTTLCTGDPERVCLWSAAPTASMLQVGVLLATAAALALLADDSATVRRDASVTTAPVPAVESSGTVRRDASVTTALVLAAAAGGVAVGAARDVGSWLVALELATVPAVALVALRGTRRAGHGALSLLVTSVTSFALLAVGVALWVTATGDASFTPGTASAAWADADRRAVLTLAVVALLAGLGFKLSLVPFHAWTPQAYSTAGLGTALFLAAASKVAAASGLLVVASALVGLADSGPLVAMIAAVAMASLLLGNVVALRQQEVTRLLAWSTIAQAGWVAAPVAAFSADGARASSAYVLAYAGATVVAFAAVALVGEVTLEGYRGLLRRHPVVGGALGLALLVLAGLPPGVIGLVAKVVVLRPVVAEGVWALVAAAMVAVVIGLAVYLRWFALLFATPGKDVPARAIRGSWATRSVLCAGAGLLAALSIWPQGLLGLLE
jgi:NADH-quinone oxidoreductase subunit N